jgi:hypothetical protein
MNITPPYGYSRIVPLEKHHRVLLPSAGAGAVPDFARHINAMAISFSEFAIAQRDYPIVFATADEGATFAPVAILGLADGQNLFVEPDGSWATGCYVPAFVRRYPFCISRVFVDGVAQDQRLVCVESSWIDDGGIVMFDAAGEPAREWTERERLLSEYEKDLDLTAQMCGFLKKLDLLAPFTMQVKSGDQSALTMQGMHCIDESRFAQLKAASHKALATKGLAARIYAHLFSLANFSRLVDRAVAVEARRKAAARD